MAAAEWRTLEEGQEGGRGQDEVSEVKGLSGCGEGTARERWCQWRVLRMAFPNPARPGVSPCRHLQRLCRLHVHQAEQLAALHQARRRQQVLRNHGRQGVGQPPQHTQLSPGGGGRHTESIRVAIRWMG